MLETVMAFCGLNMAKISNDDSAVSLVVIDYDVTEQCPPHIREQKRLEIVVLVQHFLESWKRPPESLFYL